MSQKQLILEAEALKRVAFFGVASATVAVLTAVMAVPMLYSYMVGVTCKNTSMFCRLFMPTIDALATRAVLASRGAHILQPPHAWAFRRIHEGLFLLEI